VIVLILFVVWQLYHHGENIAVNVHIANNSNRTVKKIKVSGKYTGTPVINRIFCDAWQQILMLGRNKERLARSAMNVCRRRRDFRSTRLWYEVRTSFKIRGAQSQVPRWHLIFVGPLYGTCFI
jgi:hypothetical protein